MIFLFQNPESARNSFGPVAPARATRGMQLLDEPQRTARGVRRALPRADVQHLAGLCAGREDRVIPPLVGVPIAGTLLVIAIDLTDEANRHRQRVDPRPGQRPPPTPAERQSASTRSSWRTCPKVNARRNVPNVDGAATRCPSTARVWPERNTSQSSMQSAPRHIADTKVITLRPGFAAPARSPRSTVRSTSASIPSRSASTAGSSTPAFATDPLVVEDHPRRVRQTVHHVGDLLLQARSRRHDSLLPAQEVI